MRWSDWVALGVIVGTVGYAAPWPERRRRR